MVNIRLAGVMLGVALSVPSVWGLDFVINGQLSSVKMLVSQNKMNLGRLTCPRNLVVTENPAQGDLDVNEDAEVFIFPVQCPKHDTVLRLKMYRTLMGERAGVRVEIAEEERLIPFSSFYPSEPLNCDYYALAVDQRLRMKQSLGSENPFNREVVCCESRSSLVSKARALHVSSSIYCATEKIILKGQTIHLEETIFSSDEVTIFLPYPTNEQPWLRSIFVNGQRDGSVDFRVQRAYSAFLGKGAISANGVDVVFANVSQIVLFFDGQFIKSLI